MVLPSRCNNVLKEIINETWREFCILCLAWNLIERSLMWIWSLRLMKLDLINIWQITLENAVFGHFCPTNIELSTLISSVAIKNISVGKMTKTPLLFIGLILKLTRISNYRLLYFKIIVKTTANFFFFYIKLIIIWHYKALPKLTIPTILEDFNFILVHTLLNL